MEKQLVAFSLLWSFVLFLAPVPALGNFDSEDCTVGDSPGKIVYFWTLILHCIYMNGCSAELAQLLFLPRSDCKVHSSRQSKSTID